MSDDALFETTPVPRYCVGDEVMVQTMWGDEKAVVLDVHRESGWPMVKLATEKGDEISVNVAYVRRR